MTDTETPTPSPQTTSIRIPGWLRHPATLAAGGFLIIRAIGVLALTWAPERGGRPLIEVLGIWDGGWYVRLADEGYPDHLDISAPTTDQSTGGLAFFPVYPMLMRMVSGLTGLDARWAGVGISLIAGSVAVAGIAILAGDWAGRRVGVLAALLWASAPMGVVSTLVYTEALFTALVVWAFIALRGESWVLAGGLAAVAGLTRPTGVALGVAVAAYATWFWWRGDRASREPGAARTSALPLFAGAAALAGTPAFWLWVAIRSGRWDGWFAVQEAFWGSRFDGGAAMLARVGSVVAGGNEPIVWLMSVAVVVCLMVAVILFACTLRIQAWWPMLVYTGISMIMVVGSAGYFSSKLRFLVPLFVLAFPLARWLASRSLPAQIVGVVVAVAATTVSGTWLLLTWPYAI